MPLVPETKIADVSKLISLGNLLARKVTWLVLTNTSATWILSCAFGADCMTSIAYIYSRLPRTLSCPFETAHTHNLSLPLTFFTYRDSTLSLSFSPLRQHTLSLSLSLSLSYILASSTQPHENVYIPQPFSFWFCLFG